MKCFCVLNAEKNFRIGGGGAGLKGAQPAEAVVVRGNGFSIGPAKIGTKMESVDFSVGRNLPLLCGGGNRFSAGISAGEALVKSTTDTALELAGDESRVERLRFGPVTDNKIGARAGLAGGEE
jgi:hypothetical protein